MAIRLGMIGAGMVAGLHVDGAQRAGQKITAVCDLKRDRAEALAAKCGADFVTSSVEELLARNDVDAVVVSIPNCIHCEVAQQALAAGKHLLLEKPMATSVAECDDIIRAWRASGRKAQMNFVCRESNTVKLAEQFIDAGHLGTIYHAKAMIYRRRGIPGLGRWFTTRALSGGGVLMDIGVHLIDVLLHLTGWPEVAKVSGVCTGAFGSPIENYHSDEMWGGPADPEGVFDVEDFASALIRTEAGPSMQIDVAWASNLPADSLPDGITLMGDRGGLFFNLWNGRISICGEHHGKFGDFRPLVQGNAWTQAWQSQHQKFADHIEGKAEASGSLEEGRLSQAVLEAWYRSSEEGREVAAREVMETAAAI